MEVTDKMVAIKRLDRELAEDDQLDKLHQHKEAQIPLLLLNQTTKQHNLAHQQMASEMYHHQEGGVEEE